MLKSYANLKEQLKQNKKKTNKIIHVRNKRSKSQLTIGKSMCRVATHTLSPNMRYE